MAAKAVTPIPELASVETIDDFGADNPIEAELEAADVHKPTEKDMLPGSLGFILLVGLIHWPLEKLPSRFLLILLRVLLLFFAGLWVAHHVAQLVDETYKLETVQIIIGILAFLFFPYFWWLWRFYSKTSFLYRSSCVKYFFLVQYFLFIFFPSDFFDWRFPVNRCESADTVESYPPAHAR